ncbi:hypothetical protein VSH64_13580 [Amycolatopsis rhabdoformis]|uniref:PE domain-containing protein n=1 Tax=Amycolatopsis rhabdoformis TaxID=1448059 RepID=A0ABZ1IF97_9PSEU|nr:hypothetical protein [Amycolatopsis rhabdoformis]WSE33136.1 hypothetical protein VSH64_13580 [Amycolatopsis rhabdoformis]
MIIGEAGRAAQSVFGDVPGPVYGGAGAGGGTFEMEPAELDAVIGLWEDQLTKITADGRKIVDIIAALKPPGQDSASSGYASTGSDSLRALQEQNDSMRQYVQGYLTKLKAAKDKTVATDQANAELGQAR